MVVSMMGARVCSRGAAALAMVAAFAIGCRTRPLGAGDSGAISPDAGSVAEAMADAAADQSEPRRLGDPCDHAADCESGFCAPLRVGPYPPGICCNAACNSTCAWCDLSGTCVYVPDGQRPVGSFSCYVDSATACFSDGFCDGAGNCRRTEAGYPCGAGLNRSACDGDTMVGKVCDGLGACVSTTQRSCAPYACRESTGQCWDSCETDAQCAGAPCQPDGRCGVNPEQPCQVNAECASGFCVSGVCCNTACDDPCMTCNSPGRIGTCSPRQDGCTGVDAGGD